MVQDPEDNFLTSKYDQDIFKEKTMRFKEAIGAGIIGFVAFSFILGFAGLGVFAFIGGGFVGLVIFVVMLGQK